MCLDRPTTIQSDCSFYKHSQKIRRFFFSSPTTKRPWFTVRSSSANFRDSYEELLVEKTVLCIAKQFKDSHQFVLVFLPVLYCRFWIYWVGVNTTFTIWQSCHINTYPVNSKFTIWHRQKKQNKTKQTDVNL